MLDRYSAPPSFPTFVTQPANSTRAKDPTTENTATVPEEHGNAEEVPHNDAGNASSPTCSSGNQTVPPAAQNIINVPDFRAQSELSSYATPNSSIDDLPTPAQDPTTAKDPPLCRISNSDDNVLKGKGNSMDVVRSTREDRVREEEETGDEEEDQGLSDEEEEIDSEDEAQQETLICLIRN